MSNKGLALAFLCAFFVAAPASAQSKLPGFFKDLKITHALRARWFNKVKFQLNNRLITVAARSHSSNMLATRLTAPLIQNTPVLPAKPRPLSPAPHFVRQAVFTLQHSPKTHGKGSAFAIRINGQVWGVTAKHILNDIGREPYIELFDENGKPFYTQIFTVREGHLRGADIAIFKIPPQLNNYIVPLEADEKLPSPAYAVQSAGFSRGNFAWFNKVDVLFSSPHRILARYQDFPVLNGYCGSPLLVNGKAVGVFVGIVGNTNTQSAEWRKLLDNKPINDFNQIVPIQWVRRLVEQVNHPQQATGTLIRILGRPITHLTPDDAVIKIQQFRKGRLYKQISAYPFMDYLHLERFFDVEAHDKIRVIIHKGSNAGAHPAERWYDLDLSTGTLTGPADGNSLR